MDLYQHFRDDEKPWVNKVLDWIDIVKTRYMVKRSDFLDPREQDIVRSVIGADPDISLSFWGGSVHAERQRLCLSPPYEPPANNDYGLVLFLLEYPHKFATISHPDLLGALMSLGVKREKFGDLLMADGQVQVVAAEEIADYIQMHLTEVGHHPVKLKEIPVANIIETAESWDEHDGTVSSLRLDAVAAEVYHMSRGKIVPLIKKGLVKVNWKVIDQTAFLLQEGDHISIRGFGRGKLIEVSGKTKKDKWRVMTGRLHGK